MATPAAILQIMVEANTRSATTALSKFDKKLTAIDKTTATATTRTTALGNASRSAGSHLASAARYAAGAAAAYVSIAQAKAAITTTQDLAKTTAGLNRNLGFTVKQGSRWAAVAKSRDIDSKSLTMSFTVLSRRVVEAGHAIREGGGAAETAMVPFTRLGLSQKEVLSGSKNLSAFLPQLADAFGEAEGGAKRQASAQQLLGRGYATILPLFADGAKGLKEQQHWADEYGATLDNKTVKAQMNLVSAQRESKVAILGLQVSFAQFLTPALKRANDVLQHFARILNSDDLTNAEKFEKVGAIIGKWADKALDAFVAVLPKLVEKAGQAAPKIAGALVKGFMDAPIWGKLSIIGLLGLRGGGGGGLGSAGTVILAKGGSLGKAFGASFAAAAIPQLMAISAALGASFGGSDFADKHLKNFSDAAEVMADEFDITLRKAQTTLDWMERHPGIGFEEAMEHAKDATRKGTKAIREDMNKAQSSWKGNLGQILSDSKSIFGQIQDTLGAKSHRGKELVDQNFKAAVGAIEKAMDSGAISTEKGMAAIDRVLRQKLKAYGITKVSGFITPQGGGGDSSGGGGGGSFQSGGVIVPGYGAGDKVPAMLEPGEVVINRKAVAAMGGANKTNAINSLIPRFAGGGIVALGHQLQSQGYLVGEHPAFGGVAPGVHDPGGYHPTGQALDVNWRPVSQEPSKLSALYSRLKNMSGVIELLWQVAGHFDHLHVAMAQGASGALGGNPNLKLPRFGSDFGLGALVAGGLNNSSAAIEKAMNQRLGNRTGAEAGKVGGGSFSVADMSKLWASQRGPRSQAHVAGAVGMAESGGDPNILNPSGASGLWQILGQVVAGNIFDPVVNAKNAVKKYTDAGGWSPWVAHTSGAYQQFMQSGGIAKLKKGTKGGKGPKWPSTSLPEGGYSGVYLPGHPSAGGTSGSLGYQPLPKDLEKALRALRGQTAVLNEKVANRQIMDALNTSEAGTELSAGETGGQVALYDQLIANLTERISKVKKGIKFAPGGPRAKRLGVELVGLQGITGRGGDLLTAVAARDALLGGGLPPPDDTTGEQLSLTQELLRLSNLRYGVSQAQYGVLGGMQAGGVAAPVVGNADVQIVQYSDGSMGVSVNGKEQSPKTIVRKGTRRMGRRPLPSARGH